jgi:hypothetical protein
MAKTKTNEQEAWRFYRSSMPTIVWNPDTDSALADFSEGHFTTDDPVLADRLRSMGYPEIPLDATEPPAGVIVRPPVHVIEGDVPLMSGAAGPALMETKMSKIMKQVPDPTAPAATTEPATTEAPAAKPKKKATAKKKPAKKKAAPKKSAAKKKDDGSKAPRKLKSRRKAE